MFAGFRSERAKAPLEAMRGPPDSNPVMLAWYRRRRDFVIERLRLIPGVLIVKAKGAFKGGRVKTRSISQIST